MMLNSMETICCCHKRSFDVWRSVKNIRVCRVCGLARQVVYRSEQENARIHGERYYDSWGALQGNEPYWELKKALARYLLEKISSIVVPARVLDVGCATGASLSVIMEKGWVPYGVDINTHAVKIARALVPGAKVYKGTLANITDKKEFFNAVIFSDVLEHLLNPEKELQRAYELLAPSGGIAILTPDIGSFSARLMGSKWIHIKREHLYYFSRRSLAMMLGRCGYLVIEIGSFPKPMTLEYAVNQFKSYKGAILSPLFSVLGRIVPKVLQHIIFDAPMGEILAIAKK